MSETSPAAPGRVVDEVLLAFFKHAENHYRLPDGTPTSEVREIRHSLRPVHELYGPTPAAAFGPKSLAAVRQTMIAKGLCRTLVNKRIDRVKRAFKWAVAEEVVPVSVYQGLRTLAGLQKGRTDSPRVQADQAGRAGARRGNAPLLAPTCGRWSSCSD